MNIDNIKNIILESINKNNFFENKSLEKACNIIKNTINRKELSLYKEIITLSDEYKLSVIDLLINEYNCNLNMIEIFKLFDQMDLSALCNNKDIEKTKSLNNIKYVEDSKIINLIKTLDSDLLKSYYTYKYINKINFEDTKKIITSIRNKKIYSNGMELLNIFSHFTEEKTRHFFNIDIDIDKCQFNMNNFLFTNSYEEYQKYEEKIFENLKKLPLNEGMNLLKDFIVIYNVKGYQLNDLIEESIASVISGFYNNQNKNIYISNLNALIGYQAKLDYAHKRKSSPDDYLPSGLAEIISQNDYTIDSKIAKFMFNLITNGYNDKEIYDLFRTINNEKNQKSNNEKLEKILEKLNIKKVNIGKETRDDLLANYIKIITDNYDISKLFNNDLNAKECTELFKNIFIDSTKKIIEKSLNDKTIQKEFGLLTQLCTYCLNNEQRKTEEELKKYIKGKIKYHLILTEKGLNIIRKRRIENIIKNNSELNIIFENQNKPYSEKMTEIFNKLYPEYNGIKNLDTLYTIMSKDNKYRLKLTGPTILPEIEKLPLESQNFKIDETAQISIIVKEVLKYLLKESFFTFDTYNDLPPYFFKDLEDILKKIKEFQKQSGGIELFKFNGINILSNDNLINLILYYSIIKEFNELKNKPLSIENIDSFVDKANKIDMIYNSDYNTVLGDTCIKHIETSEIKNYYNYYIDNTSKRFYRTIPDCYGKVETNGKNIYYRSYDVDDPEQLIAGIRITEKESCFRLDNVQDDTFKYIESSPNGIIIAIEDENKNFLGRVYGFRVGDKVHFTRIYYNEQFDFAKIMQKIANDIIANSKEINYVTCIPYTCLGKQFIDNTIPSPNNIKITQEERQITTDHSAYDISIIGVRNSFKNKEELKCEPGIITEKFYKKRNPIKEINFSKLTYEEKINIYSKVKNIICRSDSKKILLISDLENSYITIGEDWIIIKKNKEKEPIKIKIIYDDIEYNKLVDNEIIEYLNTKNKEEILNELKEIKNNIANLTSNSNNQLKK